MTSSDEIKKWMKNFENQTMDFKSYQILAHSEDLADLMVAFASNRNVSTTYGGKIIIGVDNNGTLEDFSPKQGHEEFIMNVARDRCSPSLAPEFEKIAIDSKVVYVITIPKMISVPYQLITNKGKTHRIRIGSTIREPTNEELLSLYSNNDILSKKPKLDKKLREINGSYRTFNVVAKDSESKIIQFDHELITWFKNNEPKRIPVESIKLIQNEIQYIHEFGNSITHGIIDEYGSISFRTSIPPESINSVGMEGQQKTDRVISIEEESSFLVGILEFLVLVYKKIGHEQNITIDYVHQNVERYSFSSTNHMTPGYLRRHYIQKSEFTISREIPVKTLDVQNISESFLDEMAKVCDWVPAEKYFQGYVKNAIENSNYF